MLPMMSSFGVSFKRGRRRMFPMSMFSAGVSYSWGHITFSIVTFVFEM